MAKLYRSRLNDHKKSGTEFAFSTAFWLLIATRRLAASLLCIARLLNERLLNYSNLRTLATFVSEQCQRTVVDVAFFVKRNCASHAFVFNS
jgi:hypothetical protein